MGSRNQLVRERGYHELREARCPREEGVGVIKGGHRHVTFLRENLHLEGTYYHYSTWYPQPPLFPVFHYNFTTISHVLAAGWKKKLNITMN